VDPDRHLFACRHRAIADFIENGAKTQQPDVGQLGERYIERAIAAERDTPGDVIKPVANMLVDEKCQIQAVDHTRPARKLASRRR